MTLSGTIDRAELDTAAGKRHRVGGAEMDQAEAVPDVGGGAPAPAAACELQRELAALEAAAASGKTVPSQRVHADGRGKWPGICYHFAAGRVCKWGDRCRFSHHVADSSPGSATTAGEMAELPATTTAAATAVPETVRHGLQLRSCYAQ
jgi:hypothetical protein